MFLSRSRSFSNISLLEQSRTEMTIRRPNAALLTKYSHNWTQIMALYFGTDRWSYKSTLTSLIRGSVHSRLMLLKLMRLNLLQTTNLRVDHVFVEKRMLMIFYQGFLHWSQQYLYILDESIDLDQVIKHVKRLKTITSYHYSRQLLSISCFSGRTHGTRITKYLISTSNYPP